jgi:serine phosphatase RsbU (regulator of sigma subunit)/tetratricopeptide (TPR) repeat protein
LVETNTDSADIFYNQGLQIANNLLLTQDYNNYSVNKIKLYKSKILSGLGYVNYLNYNYKKAIALLEESIKEKESAQEIEAEKYLLKYLSLCYFNIGDYESAIEYLYGAIEKINENPDSNPENDQKLLSEIYYSLGKNYQKLERYDKAVDFYSKSSEICIKLNYNEMLVLVLNGLAQTYIDLKKFKKAEKLLFEATSLFDKDNDVETETFAILSRVKLEFNQLDSAKYYLSKAEDIALKNKDKLGLIVIYKNYTLFQIKDNNLSEAAFYAKKYLKLGQEKKDFQIITEANKFLYQIYEEKGEYLRAFEYLKRYNNYRDSLSIEEAKNIVLKHELKLEQERQYFQDSLKFQTYKKQKEAEVNIHKLKSEKSEKEKKLLYVGVLVLSLLLFVFIKSIIQKKKDNKIISLKAKEIESQKKLLEQQNNKLKTEALLFNILRICSSDDLSIHKILNEVIDKLNNVDFLGTINKSAVLSYSTRSNQFIIEVEKNLTEDEKKQLLNISSYTQSNNKFLDTSIQVLETENFGKYYFIPLSKNNKLLGITYLMIEPTKNVTDFELNFLESIRILYADTLYRHKITDKLRIAHIENTIKKKEIQRAHERVNTSLKQQEAINGLMTSIIKNENVGDKIYLYVSEILGNEFIRRLNITLFDFDKGMVKFYFLRENGVEKIDKNDFPLSNFSIETLNKLKNNEKVIVNSIKDRENKSESDMQMIRNNINSFASFPLFMEDKLIGAMNISFENEINLTVDQESFMKTLIEGVTIAIHQNLLFNELSEKNIQLSELHQEISSSINYARNLQKSILPSTDYTNNIFNDKFILLKQRDVVGGDFYWVREYENYKMIACIDCTGHSVPGAFMTMLSRVLLREAATIKGLRKPNEIITQMDDAVKRILSQNDYNAMQDGMDMSLAVINTESKEISFSSAQRPVIIKFKDKNALEVIKGSRFPVGGFYEVEKKYDLHTFKLDELDSFYLFSDGYTDQFGGEKVKKYGFKRLLATLNMINNLPMYKQKDFLLNEFNNWKGLLNQIDDICFIGVRL